MVASLTAALLLAAAPASPLVGRWQGGLFIIVLDANGKGTLSDGPGVPASPITWKATDRSLTITEDGEAVTYALTQSKDSMTISGGDLDGPVTLTRKSGGGATADKNAPNPGPPLSARGTCQSACTYYLACGGFGPAYKAPCLAECAASGLNGYQLAVFTTLDCREAVAVVAALEIAAWQQVAAAASQQQQKNSSQCNGCVRDGNSCVWLSQSNWGTGWASPYSGAASSCDPSCCQ